MEIQVTGRNVQVSDGLKDYVVGKLAPVLESYPRVESAHVVLSLEKFRHTATVTAQGRDKLNVSADETCDDMYAAIDAAILKADKQLRKSRDKMISRQQGGREGQRLGDVEPPVGL